ncbi:MAG: HAD family hydrolase [Nocardioidaceae bacterium]
MPVRALVFDVGGVLEVVDDDAWPQTWVHRWRTHVGLTEAAFAEAMAAHEPLGDMATGQATEAEFRALYAAVLGLDDATADRMMREMWDAYCGRLDEPLCAFVATLRPSYITAILSNSADGARREEQARYGFEQLVDLVLYSHEVGVAKPDPAVYALTCERLGVRPEEVLLLDDVPANVEAARELGWHALLHTDTARSVREITALLTG